MTKTWKSEAVVDGRTPIDLILPTRRQASPQGESRSLERAIEGPCAVALADAVQLDHGAASSIDSAWA